MSVRIRLTRKGKKKQPTYRVVVADQRAPRDGKYLEQIGRYDPRQEPSIVEIDNERAQYWLGQGAQPSDAVRKLLQISGAIAAPAIPRRAIKVAAAPVSEDVDVAAPAAAGAPTPAAAPAPAPAPAPMKDIPGAVHVVGEEAQKAAEAEADIEAAKAAALAATEKVVDTVDEVADTDTAVDAVGDIVAEVEEAATEVAEEAAEEVADVADAVGGIADAKDES